MPISDSMTPDPGSVKVEIRQSDGYNLTAGLLVPEQLALLAAKEPRGGYVRESLGLSRRNHQAKPRSTS